MTLRAGAQIIKYNVTTVLADTIEKEAVFLYTLGNFGSHSVSHNTMIIDCVTFALPQNRYGGSFPVKINKKEADMGR
jgi:hypothetical protein